MMNPLTLAFLLKTGQAPEPELIEKAKRLIEHAVLPPPMDATGMPIMPTPPDGSPDEQNPDAPPAQVGEDNPNFSAMPKVNQRVLDRGGEQ